MDEEDTVKTEKKQSQTKGLIPFKKGESGNPNGRPKGTGYIEQLNKAIKIVEKEKKKELFIRFVEQAYANPSIMIALMNKLLANKMHTEIEDITPNKEFENLSNEEIIKVFTDELNRFRTVAINREINLPEKT